MKLFPRRHIVIQKAKDSLRKGLSKRKVIYSISVGLTGGLFPVIGTTTVLCLGLTFLFRANHALVQLVNWLIYPLQLLFMLPFMKLGSEVFGGPEFHLTLNQVREAFESGFFRGLEVIGIVHLYGIAAWLVLMIPLFLLSILLLNLFYEQVKRVIVNLR